MTSTTRRTVQVTLVIFGLLLGVAVMALQALTSSGDCAAAEGSGRATLFLGTVGGVLVGVGIIGMTVGTALGLTPGVSSPLVPGGRQGLRRAGRQIAGNEPYQSGEIAGLRRFAEYVVSSNRPSPAQGIAAFGVALAGVGILLGVPSLLPVDSVLITVCIVALGVGVLLLVVQQYLLRRLRRSSVANAHVFLQRTQHGADPPGGGFGPAAIPWTHP